MKATNPLIQDFELTFSDYFQPLLSQAETIDPDSLDHLKSVFQDALTGLENVQKGVPRAETQLG